MRRRISMYRNPQLRRHGGVNVAAQSKRHQWRQLAWQHRGGSISENGAHRNNEWRKRRSINVVSESGGINGISSNMA